jgi:hypothetical protein
MPDDLLAEHERDPLNPDAERMAQSRAERRQFVTYSTGQPEKLTAPLQTQLPPSACGEFYDIARRRYLTPAALLRVIVLEWMEKQAKA